MNQQCQFLINEAVTPQGVIYYFALISIKLYYKPYCDHEFHFDEILSSPGLLQLLGTSYDSMAYETLLSYNLNNRIHIRFTQQSKEWVRIHTRQF